MTVYAERGHFREREVGPLSLAVRRWDLALRQGLSGIRLKFAGERDAAAPTAGEIVIVRERVKAARGRVGEFRAQLRDARGYVTAALVALDTSIDDPKNLASLLSHELGHGFGLWDCDSCARRTTVMNQFKFPGRNVAESPSICDVLQVAAAYAAPPPAADGPLDVADETGGTDAFVGEAGWPEPPGAAEAVEGFLRAEAELREELKGYTFLREVLIQTVDERGEVSGEYRRVSRLLFDDAGNRFERVVSFPEPTLKNLKITAEDLADLSGAQPFGPDLSAPGRYLVRHAGEAAEGGERLLVLRVRPRAPPRVGERVFNGEVWVRPSDYRVVRVRGRALPEGEQRFPFFETRREKGEGGQLLPASTYADEVLSFPGRRVRMRLTVRYSDYRRYAGKVRVVEEGEPGEEN